MNEGKSTELDAMVARLADGDRSVFPLVFRTLWTPTFHLCSRMLSNDADAADAAQAAMEKIFARASDFDPKRRAMPWALAIAAWECRTIRRQKSRRREVPADRVIEHDADDAEELALQRELVRIAVEAMGVLSAVDREVLLATYWAEAADSGAVVRKRRERALERLRRALRRTYGFP